MAIDVGLHRFMVGPDSIERCSVCRTTRYHKGKMLPARTPCPTLSQLSGWIGIPTTSRQDPFDAAIWDEIIWPDLMMELIRSAPEHTFC